MKRSCTNECLDSKAQQFPATGVLMPKNICIGAMAPMVSSSSCSVIRPLQESMLEATGAKPRGRDADADDVDDDASGV